MIVTGALLFLIGTTVSAGPLIPSLPTEIIVSKHKHDSPNMIEHLKTSGGSSFIENYIQQGTNVFFKPQFMLSAEQLPPQVQPIIAAIEKDDCKTSYPLLAPMVLDQIHEPLRVVEQEIIHSPITRVENVIEIKPAEEPVFVETPMVMPQLPILPERVQDPLVVVPPGPMLPPMEMPKLPVLIEEPCEQPAPIPQVVVIPPGPILPPMEMPKLPVLIDEVPCEQPALIPPVIVEVEEHKQPEVLVAIPPGPLLPPMEMPKLPVLVEEVPCEQPAPIAPIVVEVEEPKQPEVLVVIPPGPVLPPMEMPKLPVIVEEVPCEQPVPIAPVLVEVEVPKQPEIPVVIPPGPVLPPMDMPQLPVLVEAPLVPELPCEHPPVVMAVKEPEVVVTNEIPRPMYFEKYPAYIPVPMSYHPNLPKPTVEVLPVHNVASVPKWMMSAIPNFDKNKDCVEDVVLERVLPKMEHGFLPIASELPVPYLGQYNYV